MVQGSVHECELIQTPKVRMVSESIIDNVFKKVRYFRCFLDFSVLLSACIDSFNGAIIHADFCSVQGLEIAAKGIAVPMAGNNAERRDPVCQLSHYQTYIQMF